MKRGNKRKFGRVRKVRKALFKSLATSLIERGRIETTTAKAKSLSVSVDKMITTAKKGGLVAQRLLRQSVGDVAAKKLVNDMGERFKERKGGYTRILKVGRRLSDGAEMSIIEFTS